MAKRRIYKTQSWIELVVVMVVVVAVNILGNIYYHRFDLTKEKRFSLSTTSINLCKKLKEKLYLKIYLDGEMSSLYKQLRNEVRDMAYEFREASKGKIEIEFIDPLLGVSMADRSKVLGTYAEKGIEPVPDMDEEEGDKTTFKYIVPGAEMNYAGKTVSAIFFQADVSKDKESAISAAIDNIEYEMANALRQCVTNKTKKIILADGNGEMLDARVASFAEDVSRFYSFDALNLNITDPEAGRPFIAEIEKHKDSAALILISSLQRRLNLGDLLIVQKPQKDYSPAELYLIDQFLMKGGKIMWLIDPLWIEIDSFERQPTVMAMVRGLENINASLFNYGVSMNNDLLQDLVCNRIPIPVGGQMNMVNFPYFPLFTSRNQSHVITKGLGPVWAQFPATLKIKNREGITTTPLLTSSPRTMVANAPATVEFQTIYSRGNNKDFLDKMRGGIQTSGVLLEGDFKSVFLNQKKYGGIPFRENGKSKMIVIADGDIMRNPVSSRGGNFPTGYDRYSRITFANKKFLLNCIDYLIDDNGLIEIRGKELGLRLLDAAKCKEEKTYWQMLNILVPIGLIIIFGCLNFWVRRVRYS
jgi:ABC-2 type transport system permease protein